MKRVGALRLIAIPHRGPIRSVARAVVAEIAFELAAEAIEDFVRIAVGAGIVALVTANDLAVQIGAETDRARPTIGDGDVVQLRMPADRYVSYLDATYAPLGRDSNNPEKSSPTVLGQLTSPCRRRLENPHTLYLATKPKVDQAREGSPRQKGEQPTNRLVRAYLFRRSLLALRSNPSGAPLHSCTQCPSIQIDRGLRYQV